MGDVVKLRDGPRVTLQDVHAANWHLTMHVKLAKGGSIYSYQCTDHPRLAFSKARSTRQDRWAASYFCDKDEFATLEAAVARLNGEELPPQEEKVPDEDKKPPKQRKIPLGDQILELKIMLHERSQAYVREIEEHPDRKAKLEGRMETLRSALKSLEWIRDNEGPVREFVAQKQKKSAAAGEATAAAGG